MNSSVFATIATTGFAVAFLHAAIPTHWLPFVLVGRVQGWSRGRTLAITALAGVGHVIFTTVLGIAVVWLGLELDKHFSTTFPLIAGGVLCAFGLFYLVRQFSGKGVGHHHIFGGHPHHDHHGHAHGEGHEHHHGHHQHDGECAHEAPPPPRRSDWAAITGLFALLTFSPCEGFLPVYLTGIQYGWPGFAMLSLVLAGATVTGMMLFTWLALLGLEKIEVKFIERWEAGLLGGLLCLLGLLVIIVEH